MVPPRLITATAVSALTLLRRLAEHRHTHAALAPDGGLRRVQPRLRSRGNAFHRASQPADGTSCISGMREGPTSLMTALPRRRMDGNQPHAAYTSTSFPAIARPQGSLRVSFPPCLRPIHFQYYSKTLGHISCFVFQNDLKHNIAMHAKIL